MGPVHKVQLVTFNQYFNSESVTASSGQHVGMKNRCPQGRGKTHSYSTAHDEIFFLIWFKKIKVQFLAAE